MSKNVYIGTVHNYNHREMTVNVPAGTNVSDLARAFFTDRQPEDIQPEEVKNDDTMCANNAHVTPKQPLPFLVPEKLAELGIYSVSEYEAMYRQAVESEAKILAAFLKKYRDMKVLDFRNYNKMQIFTRLHEYFPTMKQYGYDNFVAYF